MQPVAVAKRYARALADYAETAAGGAGRPGKKDPARLERVASDLSLVSRVLGGDPKFERFFADPSVSQKDKLAAMETLARNSGLSEPVRNFLNVLVINRRLGALSAIRAAFDKIKDERQGVLSAETVTAVPLSATQLKRLREALERMTGSTVRITQQIDPTLLGGARTRLGSRVYDGTLRRHLEALRVRLIGTH